MKNRTIENVLIICHYAQQPPFNTMLRYHNWGKELLKRGCKVTIIAASVVHNTDIDVIDEIHKFTDIVDGIRYIYVKTPKYLGNGIGRIKNMMAFSMALPKIKKIKADVIIGCEAYLYLPIKKVFRDIPVITDTVDLWPASIIEYSNVSKYNPIVQVLYELEKIAYIKSDALIFSMEGGKDYIAERKYRNRVNPKKIFHINMGCDIKQKDRELATIKYDLGWDLNKFNIVYCGSIRQANQVKQICMAAKEVMKRGMRDVVFHIYGNGDELDSLQQYVKKNRITNIKFYGRIEKENIPAILANSKANILTYKQVDLMKYGGSQSKLFDYLASGKPVLCNAKFGYNLIERYNCGIVTENQTPKAFADAVEKLYNMDDKELSEMGIRARKAAEAYDQPILVDQLCNVFDFIEKK